MCAQTLHSFFETDFQQRRALGAIAGAGWLGPGGNLDLYEASHCTFGPLSRADEAFRNFERIYDELKGPNWQVFRPSSPERDCLPARQVFETIKGEFPEFSWGGSINLLTLAKSGARARLESRLAKMQGIKPKKSYPHMTVSKFLHFYNPGLFPIYDNKVIWEGVFKRFRNDFRVFCGARKFRMIGRLTTALRPSCSITWTGQVRF